MANNYFDMTGVLMLEKVTPVIKALFGPYSLDERYPGEGQAYIAYISEGTDASWDAVIENLQGLATELGLKGEAGGDFEPGNVDEVLDALIAHFKADENEELANMVGQLSFEDDADLDALFVLARAFNDGHGLKAYKTEAAWHCSKPRLFEFGGSGSFRGLHVSTSSDSRRAAELGEQLELALASDNLEAAAATIQHMLATVLAGINEAKQRDAVRAKLAALLAT